MVSPPPPTSSSSLRCSTMSDHIPEEIVLRIISNLDVPTLLQSRAVCRSWKSVIDSNSAVNRLHTHCLVGYFLHNIRNTVSESPNHIKEAAMTLWGDGDGSVTAATNVYHPGFWLFSFADSKTLDSVVKSAPWFISERPIFLRQWRPHRNWVRDSFQAVPFWVTFRGFPLGCWEEEFWRPLAGFIGVVVKDGTIEPRRDEDCRVCVEVSAKEPPITRYYMRLRDGRVFPVLAEYGWMPLRCERCQVFGHDLQNCALGGV